MDLARPPKDGALPDDDDGNQKPKKISHSRGLNVNLISLQTCKHLGAELTLPQE